MTAGEESSEADDAALVRCAAARGLPGQLAFEKLVDRHQHWLVRLLIHLLGSQSDAEDVAQEAFIRAFLAIEECGDGARFRGWLRVIARRLAFNYRRDARTRAFSDAKDRAQQFADLSGMSLGKIISISETAEGTTPTPVPRAMAAAVPMEPGQQTVGFSVTVVWELS